MRCGIIGLPNAGKTTIFNALTAAAAEVANYPFTTIAPNTGMVVVPDERLTELGQLLQPQKLTPTAMEFVDIAGLIEGASKGEGLGNQFLGHIREVDLLVHVVRCFDAGESPHPLGAPDPGRDVEIVETELCLADLEMAGRQRLKLEKKAKAGEKDAAAALKTLERVEAKLNQGKWARELQLSPEELEHLKGVPLLTRRPYLFVANVSEAELKEGPYLQGLRKLAHDRGVPLIPILGDLEAEVAQLPEGERAEFLAALGVTEPGIHHLIQEAYRLLDLVTFYTVVGTEVRAWTVPGGTPAVKAAGKIHSDMEKGFIRCEVMAFADLVRLQSPAKVKESGRLKVEGKDYPVQDGEILYFRFQR